jgi:hypothetical protein
MLMPQRHRRTITILLSALVQLVFGFGLVATIAHAENRVIGMVALSVDGKAALPFSVAFS